MGMDFSALLAYDTQKIDLNIAVRQLWSRPLRELDQVVELWTKRGFMPLDDSPAWFESHNFKHPVPEPILPDHRKYLRTRGEFYIAFGKDSVHIYHPLRWRLFLTETDWQNGHLNACHAFARILMSPEGVVTRDESPIINAFHQGATYRDALAAGTGDEGEVADIALLYEPQDERLWDSHGYWRLRL